MNIAIINIAILRANGFSTHSVNRLNIKNMILVIKILAIKLPRMNDLLVMSFLMFDIFKFCESILKLYQF